MVKAATMVGLLFAAAVTVQLGACSPFGGASAFTCTTDQDCQGTAQGQSNGFCEMSTGFCAFPDDSCGSAGRYGSLAGGLSGQCVGGSTDGLPPDGPEPDGMPPDPEDVCLGTMGALVRPCWTEADLPNTAVALIADIDTDTSILCSTTVKNATACVIAGSTLSIANGITVRATGTKPLVLVATTGAIQIDGTLDVASHVTSLTTIAAGGNDGTCAPGTAPNVSSGGAGGSHGALGGAGGGGLNVAANGGVPGAASGAITTLRGGCKGQNGADGGVMNQRGTGGNGGGAVALIGKTAINVAGAVNVSGSGGTGGTSGSAGGGAGGSGGTISIDAPALTNGGQIFAHGGAGGAGSGNAGAGTAGGDPTIAGAVGGTSTTGGAGGIGGTANVGGAGVTDNDRGGGGAGGSAGIIRLFGGATSIGQVSPGPT